MQINRLYLCYVGDRLISLIERHKSLFIDQRCAKGCSRMKRPMCRLCPWPQSVGPKASELLALKQRKPATRLPNKMYIYIMEINSTHISYFRCVLFPPHFPFQSSLWYLDSQENVIIGGGVYSVNQVIFQPGTLAISNQGFDWHVDTVSELVLFQYNRRCTYLVVLITK